MLKQCGLGIVVLGLTMAPLSADAGTMAILHYFVNSTDAADLNSGVIDAGGILYGTSVFGGTANKGTVFSVNAATGVETVVYSFQGGPDGALPYGGLVYENGVLYGMTSQGGAAGVGTVFAIDVASGRERLLHSFTGGADGSNPVANLLYRNGILYGTTETGGTRNAGVLFRLRATDGKEEVLHSFGTEIPSGQNDGEQPEAGVIMVDSVLYGTTLGGGGGGGNFGAVYGFDLDSQTQAVLYGFMGKADGGLPTAGLTYRGGILYGTTSCFQSGEDCASGVEGTAFSLAIKSHTVTTLAVFGNQDEGTYPLSGLVYYRGAFYGVTSGSAGDSPTIYRIPVAERGAVVLYTFPQGTYLARGGLVYSNGAFYGATSNTVYKFVP